MIRTLNLKNSKYDELYEDYINKEIKKAEGQIKNGAKSYTEEEFAKEMRTRFGSIV